VSSDTENATAAVEKLPFEVAFQQLEQTVQRLEQGDLTLEEAIALYKQGVRLAQRCTSALDAAELQIQQLSLVRDAQQLGMFFEGANDQVAAD
jgi:exodeoxyribonuclease VII small subunit